MNRGWHCPHCSKYNRWIDTRLKSPLRDDDDYYIVKCRFCKKKSNVSQTAGAFYDTKN